MKRLSIYIAALTVTLWMESTVCAQLAGPLEFFVEGNILRASVDGTIQYSEKWLAGTKLHLDDDFQFDDVTSVSFRIGGIVSKKHEALFDYRQFNFSGERIAMPDITWSGIQFTSGIEWEPDLNLRIMRFCYGYRLVSNSAGFVAIRPGVQIATHDSTVRVPNAPFLSSLRANSSDTSAFPAIILAGEYRFHRWFAITGELSGGAMNEQSGYDILALLRIIPHRHVSFSAGYALMQYTNERNDNHFEARLGSPVIGVRIEW